MWVSAHPSIGEKLVEALIRRGAFDDRLVSPVVRPGGSCSPHHPKQKLNPRLWNRVAPYDVDGQILLTTAFNALSTLVYCVKSHSVMWQAKSAWPYPLAAPLALGESSFGKQSDTLALAAPSATTSMGIKSEALALALPSAGSSKGKKGKQLQLGSPVGKQLALVSTGASGSLPPPATVQTQAGG